MKRLNCIGRIWIVAVGLAMCACGSDDEGGNVTSPVFPQAQTLEIAAGESQEVSFEANMDWTLTSDRQWLKFEDTVGETQSLLGQAGSQRVVMTVSDGNLGFEDAEAHVTLSMGGQQAVIFTVVRPGAERVVRMYTRAATGDAALEEIQSVAIGYGDNVYIGFSGNFDWRVLSAPEWIAVNTSKDIRDLTGRAGEEHLEREDMAILTVTPSELYKDNTGEIVIGAQAEGVEYTQSFPVTAEGIAAKTVEWSSLTNAVRNEGFLFSQEGKWRRSSGMGSYEEVDDPAEWSVRVRDYKYEVKLVAWSGTAPAEVAREDAWVKFTDDHVGNLTCKADANEGEAREMGLFIIPADTTVNYADYFDAEGNFQSGWLDDKTGEFVWGGYAIRISQAGTVTNPFTIMRYNEELAPAQVASEENKRLVQNLGVQTDVVFERAFTKEEWDSDGTYRSTIQITIDDPQYDPDVEERFVCYDENGVIVPQNEDTNWGSIQRGSSGGVSFSGASRTYEKAQGHTCIVVFKDSTGNDLAAFLILMQ